MCAASLAAFTTGKHHMNSAQRLRATYEFQPVDHLYRTEFYIWDEAIERWKGEGMDPDAEHNELFGFDEPGLLQIRCIGWCEPAFFPPIVPEIIESIGDYEIVRDVAGRHVKRFKGRSHGFMPTYLKHIVTCDRDWEEDALPLLSPATPQRWEGLDKAIVVARADDAEGKVIQFYKERTP